jgi:hypothetical protein
VLQVDMVCQRRDVAAASATRLLRQRWLAWRRRRGRGVWRRVWLVGLANYFWVAGGGTRGDLGRTRALSGATQIWPKFEPAMGRAGCVGPNASHRWEGAGDALVRSDQFRRARTRCVGPLEMPSVSTPVNHRNEQPATRTCVLKLPCLSKTTCSSDPTWMI